MTAITSKTFTYAPSFSIPRGAAAGAELFLSACRLLAGLFTYQPQASADMSPEDVRCLALSVQDSDPGFSADLLAALDRHESQQG